MRAPRRACWGIVYGSTAVRCTVPLPSFGDRVTGCRDCPSLSFGVKAHDSGGSTHTSLPDCQARSRGPGDRCVRPSGPVSPPTTLCQTRTVEPQVLASIKTAFDEFVSVQRAQGWEPRRDELLKLASHMLNDAGAFEESSPLIEGAVTAALEAAK